jgi:hypothetical protein
MRTQITRGWDASARTRLLLRVGERDALGLGGHVSSVRGVRCECVLRSRERRIGWRFILLRRTGGYLIAIRIPSWPPGCGQRCGALSSMDTGLLGRGAMHQGGPPPTRPRRGAVGRVTRWIEFIHRIYVFRADCSQHVMRLPFFYLRYPRRCRNLWLVHHVKSHKCMAFGQNALHIAYSLEPRFRTPGFVLAFEPLQSARKLRPRRYLPSVPLRLRITAS